VTVEHRAPRNTAFEDFYAGTAVDVRETASSPAALAREDALATRPVLVGYRTRPARSLLPSITGSLAWPALLIVAVRLGVGLLLERAVLGMFFPSSRAFRSENSALLWGFFRWDAGFYTHIAAHGYPKNPIYSSFYPLYPFVTRVVSDVTGLGASDAALAVSWISLWVAVWGVMRLTALIFPESKAWRAGALLAFVPVSVFLLAGYPESLYMALFAWCLVALFERRAWLAAALAGLVAVTRLEGVLLVLAVVGWAVQDELTHRQRSVPRAAARIAGLCVVILTPLFGYLLFVWRHYGHIFEAVKVNRNSWHRQLSWPLHPLFASLQQIFGDKLTGTRTANYVTTYLVNDLSMVAAIIGLAALCVIVWRRRELWWLVPPLFAAVLIIASNQPWGTDPEGWARNVMVLVPLYAVASRINSEVGWSMLLAGSALLAALFQIMFNIGLWLT
jgi:hypothetical protein